MKNVIQYHFNPINQILGKGGERNLGDRVDNELRSVTLTGIEVVPIFY